MVTKMVGDAGLTFILPAVGWTLSISGSLLTLQTAGSTAATVTLERGEMLRMLRCYHLSSYLVFFTVGRTLASLGSLNTFVRTRDNIAPGVG